nr:ABC transporter ATP-binding protein [Halonotius terrestris]
MLDIDGLSHRYGTEQAVDDVSFGLADGEIVGLLGPSGCGKTTIVQAIAGHLRPTEGRIRLRGTDVTAKPPESRGVAVVFQQSTLFDHMTVAENIAYGLADDADPVADYLDLVSLTNQQAAYPAELSGGQQRRAELARALATDPDVLLLDEPLSALDRALRTEIRAEIDRIQRETGVTTLFVTHDQSDAMALADRLVVMQNGAVAGVGEPRTLYESPPTPFVADFLGRSTTLQATVAAQQPLTLSVADSRLVFDGRTAEFPTGTPVTCYLRPEALTLEPQPDTSSLPCEVVRVVDVGRHYDVTVALETGEELLVEQSTQSAVGTATRVSIPARTVSLFAPDETAPPE